MSTPEAVTRAKSFMSAVNRLCYVTNTTGLEEPATHSVLRHVGSGTDDSGAYWLKAEGG